MGIACRVMPFAFLVTALIQVSPGLAGTGPYYVDGGHFFVKPQLRIDLSGTGSWYIGNSRWLTWSPRGATAATTFYTNICKPNCAAGRLRSQPAHVRLFGLVVCRGSHVFNRFRVTSSNRRLLLSGTFRAIGYLSRC